MNKQFTVDDHDLTMVGSLYPNCDWIYYSMTVRTGDVLVNVGIGEVRSEEAVEREELGDARHAQGGALPGRERRRSRRARTTVTDWRVTLYPYKKKRR